MTTALRVTLLLMWSGYRIQRWPASIGLVLLVAGAIAAWFDSVASIGFGIFGLILLLAAPALVGGMLMRAICAPRTVQLIPHGRAQLLLAMMFCALVMASLTVAVVWLLEVDPPPPTPLFPIFTLCVALATAMLLGMFTCSASVPGLTLWAFVLGSAPYALAQLGRHHLLTADIFTPARELLFAALLWATFSLWYLRVRGISPGDPTGTAASGVYAADLRVGKSRNAAIMALLLGQSIRSLLWSALMGTLVMVAFATLINSIGVNKQGDPIGVVGATFTVFLVSGIGSFIAVRRSKVLWLKAGCDRMQLFALCERQSWLYFITMSAFIPIAAVVLLAFSGMPAGVVLLTMVAFFGLGAAVLYLGLMHLQEWRLVDLVIGLVLAAAWMLAFVWIKAVAQAPYLTGLLAILAAAVLLLRAEARRRWRNIDWLICKTPRVPARGAAASVRR